MNWAVKLSSAQLSITERVVTVAERARCSAGKPRASERTSAVPTLEQRRRCAVIIDRDPEVISGLSALLAPELEVHSAVSPLSAALLLDGLEHVDLAFLELELPDFAGEQLLQQLGRWPDAIRVLLAHTSLDAARERSRGPSTRVAPSGPGSALPRNAYLAHLVLSKPVSAEVVRALQRATLGLLRV